MTLRRLRPLTDRVWVATSRMWRTTSIVLSGPGRTALLVAVPWAGPEVTALVSGAHRAGHTSWWQLARRS